MDVYNNMGRPMMRRLLKKYAEPTMDIHELANGIYFLRTSSQGEVISTVRLMIAR